MPKPRSPKADAYVLALCAGNPHLLIPHWLVASFMYYVEDSPVLSDAAFDHIVKELGDKWETITHRHKDLLDPTMLRSGFYIKDYPLIVQGAAKALRELVW